MTLKEALKESGMSYRTLSAKSGISKSALCRWISGSEALPRKVDRKKLERIILDELRERRQIDAEIGEVEQLHINDREEIELMQLSREVLQHFSLRGNPFLNDIESDDDVFPDKGHAQVASAIRDVIEERGFLAITAPSGAGKTTIWEGVECEYGLRDDTIICKPAIKNKDRITPEHLARALIYGLLGEDVAVRANAEDRGRQLSRALRAVNTETYTKKAVLYIDDAHYCNVSTLRQLKTFFEEKIGRYRLLAIVLVGLPALKDKLAAFPEIGNRVRLIEVPQVPVKEYLEFKLRRAGGSLDKLFDAGGLDALLERFRRPRRGSYGFPLIINATCIRAMVRLHECQPAPGSKITREVVDSLPGAVAVRRAA